MGGNSASGRKRKPSALRLLEGNRGHRPVNMGEPQPKPLLPDAPDWLCEPALAEWIRITSEMCEVPGWLTVVDHAVLAAYCQSYGRWQEAERQISQHGAVFLKYFVDPTGTEHTEPKASPWVKISKDERVVMKSFALELGISPSSRARLNLSPRSPGGEEDDLDGSS